VTPLWYTEGKDSDSLTFLSFPPYRYYLSNEKLTSFKHGRGSVNVQWEVQEHSTTSGAGSLVALLIFLCCCLPGFCICFVFFVILSSCIGLVTWIVKSAVRTGEVAAINFASNEIKQVTGVGLYPNDANPQQRASPGQYQQRIQPMNQGYRPLNAPREYY